MKHVNKKKQVYVEEELVEVICDNCGDELKKEDYPSGIPYCSIEYSGGYSSTFPGDLQTVKIDLCETCLEKFYRSLKHKQKIGYWSNGEGDKR